MIKRILLLIFSMSLISQQALADDTNNKTANRALCERIAYLANAESLKSVEVKYQAVDEEIAYKLFPKKEIWSHTRIWKIDINNDGLLEIVAETSGQQVMPLVYITDTNKGFIWTFEADNDETNVSVIKIQGQYYLLGFKYNGSLTKLWEINTPFSEVCSFKQLKTESILFHGTELEVCKAADRGDISYIKFSSTHSIKTKPDGPRFRDKSVMPGMATADIENTGVNKNIIRLIYVVGNGIQCDTMLLAVIDEKKETIPDIPVNKVLFDMPACVPILESDDRNINIFQYNSKTYIDAEGYDGKRDIFTVKNGRLKCVCKFRGKIINELN